MTQSNAPAGFCTNCGNQFLVGQKFCGRCGTKRDYDAYSTPSMPPLQSAERPRGFLSIKFNKPLRGKTVVITSMANESEVFYAPIITDHLNFLDNRYLLSIPDDSMYGAEAGIYIPVGNYSVTIMGEDGRRYVTLTEAHTELEW